METAQVNIHQDLVDSCLRGDQSAFYQLYNLYSRAMYNTALRIVRDSDDAEDILQDAFVSAFRSLASYSGRASFGAWLKRIVINKGINFLRKQRANLVEINEGLDIAESREPEPDYEFEVSEIKKAIAKLSDGYRVVLSLYLLEGYDHKEISEILGISESTSKTQYLRAKQKVIKLIGKEIDYER